MMPERVQDNEGLICAFAGGAQAAQPLTLEAAMAVLRERSAPVWLHFNLVDTRARNRIAASEWLPATAREFLLGSEHYVHFGHAGHGIAGVIGDLHHDLDPTPESLAHLRLYVDHSVLVTVRKQPLRGTDRVRRDLHEGARFQTPLHLLTLLLARVAEAFGSMVAHFGDIVDEAEDRLLVGDLAIEARELGRVRGFLARLRRHMIGTRGIDFDELLDPQPAEGDVQAFRRALERMDAVSQDLDLVQTRARLLQEEISARLGEATNRNVYFLSIVTALLLPVTLVTGIFGMNVGGLPWTQGENGFVWTLVVMALTLAGTVAVLRARDFF